MLGGNGKAVEEGTSRRGRQC